MKSTLKATMTNEQALSAHRVWTPHTITHLVEPSPGFIGRAAAMVIDGIEVVLLARTIDDLAAAIGSITQVPLDESMVYKVTLLQSTMVEVDVSNPLVVDHDEQDMFDMIESNSSPSPQAVVEDEEL